MNSQKQNMFSTLLAFIVGKPSQPTTRRAIVAQPAKRPLPSSVAAQTIIHQSALSAVQNYQTASDNGRRAIVAKVAKPQPVSVGSAGQLVPPLNRGWWDLSQALLLGRELHPPCRGTFVQKVQRGYYDYERRYEWQTCALAAAYAGIFGPAAVELPTFSYSQCVWKLTQVLGYDPSKRIVEGPTGRRLPVVEEMVKLTDDNLWQRRTVAAWLWSVGL